MIVRAYPTYIWNTFRYFLMMVLVLSLATVISAQNDQRASTKKPTILVLGVYHLNSNGEDVTTPKRQKEIGEIVALLKKFQPTKIAVEALFDNAKINEDYSQYLSGNYELSPNETNQIGFRLAKELNHTRVYPIDWRNKFDLLPVMAFANANKQGGVVQKGMARFTEQEEQLKKLIKTATVLEILRFLNDDKSVKEVDYLMLTTLVHVGKDNNYVGTDVLAGWYERNLKIFTNLTRIIESGDDRVLVIIGSGHTNLLRHFIEESGEYILEKPEKYLK
ncbi:MAG: DUF5694 domain-containing protein [Acidobacteriota bacterium]